MRRFQNLQAGFKRLFLRMWQVVPHIHSASVMQCMGGIHRDAYLLKITLYPRVCSSFTCSALLYIALHCSAKSSHTMAINRGLHIAVVGAGKQP